MTSGTWDVCPLTVVASSYLYAFWDNGSTLGPEEPVDASSVEALEHHNAIPITMSFHGPPVVSWH
jgi:hypothetical protein